MLLKQYKKQLVTIGKNAVPEFVTRLRKKERFVFEYILVYFFGTP